MAQTLTMRAVSVFRPPVGEHPDGSGAPAHDLSHLGHVETGHDPEKERLRLIWRQGGDQREGLSGLGPLDDKLAGVRFRRRV